MFLFTHNEQLENLTIAHSVWAYFLLLLLFDAGPSWSVQPPALGVAIPANAASRRQYQTDMHVL
jgi:hypothetical protein